MEIIYLCGWSKNLQDSPVVFERKYMSVRADDEVRCKQIHLCFSQINHPMIYEKKKGSLEHKQYIILKLLSCKRKRRKSLNSPTTRSCPMHLPWNSPIETGSKQLLTTAFLCGNQLPVMKLYLRRTFCTEESQDFPALALFVFHSHLHTHSRSISLTCSVWLKTHKK